jgi:hypothetical protein
MKIATGTVVDVKVVVDGETLIEGSTVSVLLRDDEETFALTAEEEADLSLRPTSYAAMHYWPTGVDAEGSDNETG